MENQEQLNSTLLDRLPELYSELKPALVATAYKYKVPNPDEFADGWLSRAYLIIDKFDKGHLEKKVYLESEGKNVLVDYDPKVHKNQELDKSLKAYLKRSFINDVIKQYHKEKKKTNFQKNYVDSFGSIETGGYSTIDSFLHYDSVFIDDVIGLLEVDIKRLESNTTSVLDKVTQAFLKAMHTYCLDMQSEYGNFVVVKDVDISDNKRFFSENFRADLEHGVRAKLCETILKEKNPVLIKKLSYLIDPKKRGTLQKRLFRYLFEYHNGYPKRLRNRVKNKTLR